MTLAAYLLPLLRCDMLEGCLWWKVYVQGRDGVTDTKR